MMHAGRILAASAATAAGAAAVAALAVASSQAGTKALILVAGLFGAIILSAVIRDAVAVLMVGLVFAIAYNRQYYSFDAWFGDHGPGGPYWTPPDLVMLAIVAAALAQAAVTGRISAARAPRRLSVAFAYLALIAAMAVSAFRVDTVLVPMLETMRIVKYLLMFVILRSLMDENRATALIVGLGLMVLAQFAIGVLQVTLSAGGSGLSSLSAETGEMARRATGTLGHPNMYAPFLLNVVLGFLAMGAARLDWRLRAASVAIGVLGCLAIVLSQSRAPAGAMMAAMLGMYLLLVLRGAIRPLRLLGSAMVCAVIGMIAIAPLADRIMDRLTGDFGASVDFRADYNEAAIAIWRSEPIFGVGPMRFFDHLEEHNPELFELNSGSQELRHALNFKTNAPVHNVYLLLVSEIGIIGLLTFVAFLAALGKLFHDASRSPGPEGLFFVGVLWGFAGVTIQQITDFSFWFDHHMALTAVLAALAGYVRDREDFREGHAA